MGENRIMQKYYGIKGTDSISSEKFLKFSLVYLGCH
jgi:hypothetical protein